MKKRGFTLAEVLVTIAIIAVAAATLAPIYLKAKPDQYKFKVIRCYNMINDANERLLDNPYLYESARLESMEIPATETEAETGFSYTGMTAECKYSHLMKQLLHLTDVSACTGGKYQGKSADNTLWTFTFEDKTCKIRLAFPRSIGNSCGLYHAANCKNPNEFEFVVGNYGDVFASNDDELTGIFLENISNIHKQDDYSQL